MTREPFTAEHLTSEHVLDANGRHVGRFLATENGTDNELARVIMELDADVRHSHRVTAERVAVPVRNVNLEDGEPRLKWSLDDLLDFTGASHAHGGKVTKEAPDRPEHFGAPADPRKAHD